MDAPPCSAPSRRPRSARRAALDLDRPCARRLTRKRRDAGRPVLKSDHLRRIEPRAAARKTKPHQRPLSRSSRRMPRPRLRRAAVDACPVWLSHTIWVPAFAGMSGEGDGAQPQVPALCSTQPQASRTPNGTRPASGPLRSAATGRAGQEPASGLSRGSNRRLARARWPLCGSESITIMEARLDNFIFVGSFLRGTVIRLNDLVVFRITLNLKFPGQFKK